MGRDTAQNPYKDLRHIPISETLKREKEKYISVSRKRGTSFSSLGPVPGSPFVPGSDPQFCSHLSSVFVKSSFGFILRLNYGKK